MQGHLIHDNAMTHTSNFSVSATEKVFSKRLLIHGMWPEVCNYCFSWKLRERVYSKNPYALHELKDQFENNLKILQCVEKYF